MIGNILSFKIWRNIILNLYHFALRVWREVKDLLTMPVLLGDTFLLLRFVNNCILGLTYPFLSASLISSSISLLYLANCTLTSRFRSTISPIWDSLLVIRSAWETIFFITETFLFSSLRLFRSSFFWRSRVFKTSSSWYSYHYFTDSRSYCARLADASDMR